MENENNNVINEEQIKKEAKIEFEKEAEIKEQVRQEVQEEIRQEEIKKQESKSRKKGVFRFIYNTIITLLILFVVFETVMGLLDMQRLNDDNEPIWYIDSKVEERDNVKETTYNLGLYVIEKTESSAEKKVVLKPFFMKSKK